MGATSYEAIVDHCCDAWNRLVDRPYYVYKLSVTDIAAILRRSRLPGAHRLSA